MSNKEIKNTHAVDCITFQQGQDSLITNADSVDEGIRKIKDKLSDLTNIKNLHFLLGAGASSDAIPPMGELVKKLESHINSSQFESILELYGDNAYLEVKKKYNEACAHSNNNIENILGTLYSKRSYLKGVGEVDQLNDLLISTIEYLIYSEINIDISSNDAKKSLGIYKNMYQKLSLRNKDLARVNVFTTNNDLLSETALGSLNINYNNGFSSGLIRTFNPARFSYTFSRKIDSSMQKYEPLENMIYLYKLHGSINWVESDENYFFNIREIDITPETPANGKNTLIYPTPLKQNRSLGAPYADLIREFQNKLLLQHGVLIVIGYSFSDEHINNAIYSALASNSTLSVVIFGDYPNESLAKLTDRRIYQINGHIENKDSDAEFPIEKIHYFDYIVRELIPDLDKVRDSQILEDFVKAIKSKKGE